MIERTQAHALVDWMPPLLLTARQIAGAVMGVHGKRRSGPGDSFWQYRVARPGDSVRQIDWRQSARTQHLHVRETEWAAAQTIHLWCDRSVSLEWRSLDSLPPKSERAMVLALAIALLLLRSGERICPFGSAPTIGEGQLDRIALDLCKDVPPDPGPILAAGHAVVLISDFLSPIEHWSSVIKAMSRKGITGHLVHVMDPAEVMFPYEGRIDFQGLEQDHPIRIGRAEDVADSYRERMHDHCQSLTRVAQSMGWTHLIHRTDHTAQTALLSLHACLSERMR
jgi:uncharacterized protein (DUF58 family)